MPNPKNKTARRAGNKRAVDSKKLQKKSVIKNAKKQVFVATYRSIYCNMPISAGRWVRWLEVVAGLLNVRAHTPEKESALLLCFTCFNGTRSLAHVVSATAVVLDCDDGTPLETVREKIKRYEYVVYSTHSHSAAKPKYRIIFPLQRNITAKEYAAVWTELNRVAGGIADKNAKDASRLSYMSSCPEKNIGIAFAIHNKGTWLDPDKLLASAPKVPTAPAGRGMPAANKTFRTRAIPRHIRGRFNRDRLPAPEAVLRRLNIDVPSRISGEGYWKLTCPFHKDGQEEHPSLSLHSEDGHYKCFACDAKGGDILSFYMAVTRKSFKEAAYVLGAWR